MLSAPTAAWGSADCLTRQDTMQSVDLSDADTEVGARFSAGPVAESVHPVGPAAEEEAPTAAHGPPAAEEGEGEPELQGCARFWPPSWSTIVKTAVFLAFVGLLLFAFLYLRIHEQFGTVLEWVEGNKVAGAFAFAGLYAVCTVLFVPGAILSLGAGLVFGIWLGVAVVWVGATIGQTAAFPLGRFLLRDWIAKKTKSWKIWQAVETAIKEEAWKIVFLLRLAPLVPYAALNYALGLTSVGFWPYTIMSAVGIIPGTFLYVYFGSLATDIASIVSGKDGVDTTTTIITAAVSGVVIILVLVLVSYYAKRALNRSLEKNDVSPEEEGDVEAAVEAQSSSAAVVTVVPNVSQRVKEQQA